MTIIENARDALWTVAAETLSALKEERDRRREELTEIEEFIASLEAGQFIVAADASEVITRPKVPFSGTGFPPTAEEEPDEVDTSDLGAARGPVRKAEKQAAVDMTGGIPQDVVLPNGRRVSADQIIRFKQEGYA